jgi:hypothetical protein
MLIGHLLYGSVLRRDLRLAFGIYKELTPSMFRYNIIFEAILYKLYLYLNASSMYAPMKDSSRSFKDVCMLLIR